MMRYDTCDLVDFHLEAALKRTRIMIDVICAGTCFRRTMKQR